MPEPFEAGDELLVEDADLAVENQGAERECCDRRWKGWATRVGSIRVILGRSGSAVDIPVRQAYAAPMMDAAVRDYLRGLGRKGGAARAKKLTPAQRRAIAKRAAVARWGARPTPRPVKG